MVNNAIRSIATNPIFVRLTRRGISLRVTVRIANVSLLFSALVGIGIGAGFSGTAAGVEMYTLIAFVLSIPVAFYAPMVAAFAATIASADVQSEDYTMLKLTLITPQRIVNGYVFSALYRLRVLHAVVIGLSLLGFFQWVGMGLTGHLGAQPAMAFSAGANMALSAIAILRIVGRGLFAAALGVALSLLWRRRGLAIIASATVIIVIQGLNYVISILITYSVLFGGWGASSTTDFVSLISVLSTVYAILSLILIYLLAWGTMRLARHGV